MNNYKHTAKVDLANGETRYFYSAADYAAYKNSTKKDLIPGMSAKKTVIKTKSKSTDDKGGVSKSSNRYVYNSKGKRTKFKYNNSYTNAKGTKTGVKTSGSGSELASYTLYRTSKSGVMKNTYKIVSTSKKTKNGEKAVAKIISRTGTQIVKGTNTTISSSKVNRKLNKNYAKPTKKQKEFITDINKQIKSKLKSASKK